jgi:hypothetical protein
VAARAERDQSVEVERVATVADRVEVVDLQVVGRTALHALIAITPACAGTGDLPRA